MLKKTQVGMAAAMLVSGLSLLAPPVMAQGDQRIEVTGSRIRSFETEGAAPVISLGLEAIRVDAARSVEGLLNNLPQVFADYGGQVSNGASGTATVNLRGLGRNRTLVLVNGRRLPAGSPRLLAADLNQIPVTLIRRVEVLTGGASAVYGSDAVSGVINFILNDRFEGVSVEANHQFYQHKQQNPNDVAAAQARRGFTTPGDKSADGKVNDLSITVGSNFAGNKGNAVMFMGYKKEDALLQSERDFSACSLAVAGSIFNCGGSSTSYPGRFILADGTSSTVADAAGGVRPWTAATDLYNFGPLNYFQRPSERYTMTGMARYDVTPMARAYLETSFHDDSTVAQIAPSGLFGFDASGANALRYENPLLSTAWRNALAAANAAAGAGPFAAAGDRADALILRRNVEGGGRQDDVRHSSYRFVTGVKGDVGPLGYDLFVQTGRVLYQESYLNDFSITRSARALDVVLDANGNAVCRSVVDGSDPNCVPYNIWTLGGVTPAALAYLSTPGFQRGYTSQKVYGLNGNFDAGAMGAKLPTASSGLALAFGYEHREEQMQLRTDTAFTTGDLAGQGGPTIGVEGKYSVEDLFVEGRLPLVEKMPLIQQLSLSASARTSKYSTGPKANAYGLGLEYAPVNEAKVRTSFQRSIRAPNIIELFSAQSLGLYNMNSDPCAGATPARSAAECARTGVTAAQYGTIVDSAAGQYNAIFGGNPSLKPETADSVTFGLVLTPTRDLSVSLDYFQIELKDVINNVNPVTTLTLCLDTGNPLYCNLIQRDARGTLWATPQAFIQAGNTNLSIYRTKGWDIAADYRMGLGGMGRVTVDFKGTRLDQFEIEELPGQGSYDCAGYYGAGTCGTPNPKWRHKLRTTWNTPLGLDASLSWRYIGKVREDVTNPQIGGTVNAVQETAGARNYFDIGLSYNFLKNYTVRFNIANLLDKDPPLSNSGAPFGNGNTYPVVYDALGRRFSLNLNATF